LFPMPKAGSDAITRCAYAALACGIVQLLMRIVTTSIVRVSITIPRFIDSPKNRLPWGDFWIRHGA
jgi:hypothetical protein